MRTEELTLRQIKTELRRLETAYTKLYRQYKAIRGDIGREDLSSSLQKDIYENGLSDKITELSARVSGIESKISTLNRNISVYNEHKHSADTGKPTVVMAVLED